MATSDGESIDRFVSDLNRWIAELERQTDQRSTLWFGIAQRAFTGFDHFLGWLIGRAVTRHPEQSRLLLEAVLAQKPLDKATLGQKVNVLRSLDRQRLICDRQLLTKADNKQLDLINSDRNAAAHQYGWDAGHTETLKTLKALLDLSQRLRESSEPEEPSTTQLPFDP